MTKYEVQTYTLCDGFVNTWSTEDAAGNTIPSTFDTREAAQAEIDEFFDDIESEIAAGERGADEGYDRDDFQIVLVGQRYVDPATATLMNLLTEGEKP